MEVACQLKQPCHYQKITISDWFESFLVSNSIIVISKVSHTWIIFPRSWRSLPTKPIFERMLTKAFCQHILSLMSKNKLDIFNDWINAYFQSFTCLPLYEYFVASIFCKVSLVLLNRIHPILERLKENITKPWKPLIIDRSKSYQHGFHSNSRGWLFWVFTMSKIDPLMNKSVLFWQDM